MAFKRALVVDDSRTARQSLAKLLAQHDLEVAFAETGEEALTFLHHELVDVIFMDHTMPGMDGLEAVSAIKGNPRTATIPVMMYTTKEGEVYVSQARALGAVGVLPKQVQPGVLFDMLNKLGLISDRRNPDAPPPADAPQRRLTDLADEVDREYEQRAQGISVQTLVTRILEEQHLKLRGDILASQRRFARQVAAEILEQHPAGNSQQQEAGTPAAGRAGAKRSKALAGTAMVLTLGLLAMGAFTWYVMAGRDAARLEIARMTTAARNELDALYQRNDGLAATMRSRDDAERARHQAAIETLQWSLNQSALIPFDEPPFDDAAALQLGELLSRLTALEFHGRVVLTAELAPFCLTRNASGMLDLADPELPADACELIGHPLQDSYSVAALQSVGFAAAMDDLERYPDITVELAAANPFDSHASPPSNVDNAGDWNRLAARLNRIHVALTPGSSKANGEIADLR
jgi:CheY-like chemotaxis protein